MKGKATKPDNDTKPSENLNNSSIINDQNKGPQSSKPDKSVNKYSSQQTLSVAENLQLPEGPLRKEKRKKSNIKGKGGGGGVSFREVNDVISPDMDIPLDLLKKFKPKFNIFQSRKIELSSIQVMSFSQNNEKKTESPRHRPTKNANFDGDFKINIQNENMNQVFSSINTTHIRKRLQEDEIELIEALEKNSYINIYKAFYKDRFIILKIVEVNNKEENDVFDEDDVIEDFQNEHDIYEKLLSFSNYSINNIISIYAREREIVPSREKTINAVMACEFGRY